LRAEKAAMALRILIVEDHYDTADTLRRLLELFGYDVKVAYSGPEGLVLARDWLPDFALCDIGLPGLSGWELARELRQDPKTAKMHLLAITGYGSERDRQRSKEAGFERHLVKPVDPAVLAELLV
jgi:CheY-like chemotaxis protein